jgi:hypothetical protein
MRRRPGLVDNSFVGGALGQRRREGIGKSKLVTPYRKVK